MAETLVVNEVYLSLQGESTFAGLPCVFVRLTACNLRCSYCDTAYAFTEGRRRELADVLAEVQQRAEPWQMRSSKFEVRRRGEGRGARGEGQGAGPALGPRLEPARDWRLPLVELTGGEPLLQPAVLPLMRSLCDEGFIVLLETSGALDIALVDARVRRIMDLKCPSSGEAGRNRWENLDSLRPSDEVKFVIGTVQDYEWTKEIIARHRLDTVCPILVSSVAALASHQQDPSLQRVPAGQTPLSRRELAERILADALPVRFQVQMHKVIWPPEQRGV